MLRSTFILILNLIWLIPALAQSTAALKSDGEKAFSDGRWAEAKSLLAQYQERKPGNFDVLTKLGICSYHLGQGTEARRYLEYVVSRKPNGKDLDLLYYLARTLHSLSEWDRAIAAYKGFMRACGEKHPWRSQAAENIRRCAAGMQIAANQDVALVENLGNKVNSPGDEFAPLPSLNHPGRIYYAAARSGCEGGQRNDDGYEDSKRGHWCSDMFVAQVTNSGWEASGSLGGLLNTSRFEIPLGFDGSGQVLYFFRGLTTFAGEFFADTAARKDEYALDPPKFKSTLRPEEGDNSPYFYNDNTIIFSSRRAGGYGGLDLWLTTFNDSTWSEPVNLGADINSVYDETTPFLARDGKTLYFSSNRPESMGGLDIFSSVFDENSLKWQPPANMGAPVNSPDDDAFFRLAPDGQTAFLSSDRLGGSGGRDLYIVYFNEAVAAQTGQPGLFFETERAKAQGDKSMSSATLPVILFENDRDLSNTESRKIVQEAAGIALKHPEAGVLVSVFSDDSGQAKFDLYAGIKSAEVVGESLTKQGVPASRIQLRSVGQGYPLAPAMAGGVMNPVAAKINHRAEITFTSFDGLNFDFQLQRPQTGEQTAAGIALLDAQNKGLAFRVEATSTRQILANDAIFMYGDTWIESKAGSGNYQYMAGYFQQFGPAFKLMQELQSQGFADARIVAYLNGQQVSKAEAVAHLKKYPELRGFIRG